MSDIISNYKPIIVKSNRFYKSPIQTKKLTTSSNNSSLTDFEESMLNPFDFIDSKYFDESHIDNQTPLIVDYDNDSFSIYMILYRLITKYNIQWASIDSSIKYINKLSKYKVNLHHEAQLNTKYDVYCVTMNTVMKPEFWKDKNGACIVVKVDPKEHTNKNLRVLNCILSLSTNSYIEVPINHNSCYFVISLYIHQNFHQLYKQLENEDDTEPEINIIFNKAINVLNETIRLKNNYKNYEWTPEAAEYVLSLNLNYCYSVCKNYNIDINPIYLNEFKELKEITLKHSKYITRYFPYEINIPRYYLQITNVGLYSITKPHVTHEIIKLMEYQIQRILNKELSDLVITDGTGGVGGDAIMFSKYFKFTNVVEIVKTHFDIIRNNLKVYKRKNYKLYHDNYLNIFNNLEQDIIYLDSPWGGVGYKNQKQTDIYMFQSSLTFNAFVDELTNKNCVIFIKCPINYNVFELSKKIKYNIEVFNMSNFLILVLSNKHNNE